MKLTVPLALLIALTARSASAADLLVSNYFGDNVARFSLANGIYQGNLTGGRLDGVLGSRIGPDGKLYVASEINNRIERYDPRTGRFLDVFARGRGLAHPTAVTFAGDYVLVANFDDSSIAKYGADGRFAGYLSKGRMSGPDVGTVVGPDGALYVPSFNDGSVLKLDPATGAFLSYFIPPKGLAQPRTILFRNGLVYVSSDSGNQVVRYRMDGTRVDIFVPRGSGGLRGASGMAFGEDGYLYVTSWRNNRVLRFRESDGAFVSTYIWSHLRGPTHLTVIL